MQLIVITPETDTHDEAGVVNRLLKMGLSKLHIRKPLYDATAYRNYISGIPPEYHGQLVIHGSYELYAEGLAGSIHLRSAIRGEAAMNELIAAMPREAVSTSLHSWEELTTLNTQYGHIFISPLFDSISKPGYKGCVDIKGIIHAKAAIADQQKQCPMITALGGINKSNILSLKTYGYDAAALLGAIWKSDDPFAAFMEIKAAI